MSNIVEFPKPEEAAPDFLVGPFESWRVVVAGRVIPNLTGRRHADGSVSLTVDGRFGATFPTGGVAEQAAWLIAQAMAIGAGYAHLGAESKNSPFAPICMQITSVTTDPPQ